MSALVKGWALFWDGARMSRYGDDGSRLPGEEIIIGGQVTLIGGRIKPCAYGLHGTERLADALGYAPCPNPVIGRCEFGGTIRREGDKLAARSRTVLWALSDAQSEAVLRAHARYSALTVHHLWNAPEVVTRYLVTGDESLRNAARAAVRDAGMRGTWGGGWGSDSNSARYAASHAVADGAGDAARDAAWSACGAITTAATRGAAGVAARDVAWREAWTAAWAASNVEIERLAWAAHNARADGLAWALPPVWTTGQGLVLGTSREGTGEAGQ